MLFILFTLCLVLAIINFVFWLSILISEGSNLFNTREDVRFFLLAMFFFPYTIYWIGNNTYKEYLLLPEKKDEKKK